jgi:hypothetical protein
MKDDMIQDPKFCDRLHRPLIKEAQSIRLLMDEREKQNNFRFDNIDKNIVLAREQMESRLEGMNEIREQLTQQAKTFVSTDKFENLGNHVNRIDKTISLSQGSSKWSDHIITVLIGLAVIVIVYLMTKGP